MKREPIVLPAAPWQPWGVTPKRSAVHAAGRLARLLALTGWGPKVTPGNLPRYRTLLSLALEGVRDAAGPGDLELRARRDRVTKRYSLLARPAGGFRKRWRVLA